MMESIVVGIVTALLTALISVLIVKKFYSAKFDILIEQAKAKAKVIEHEAEVILKDAQVKAKRDYDKEFQAAKKEYDEMAFKIERKEKELNKHLETELRIIQEQKDEIIEKNKKSQQFNKV